MAQNFSEESAASVFRIEERFLQNTGPHLPNYMTSHPRKP